MMKMKKSRILGFASIIGMYVARFLMFKECYLKITS